MKLSQKAKYIGVGIVATALVVPLAVIAEQTISLTFKDGDVISANVMNQIFSRINNVVTGFTSPTELDGTWTCTTYGGVPAMGGTECTAMPGSPLLSSKVGTITFTSGNKTYSYTGVGPIGSCMATMAPASSTTTGSYDVIANHLAGGGGVGGALYALNKVNPNEFTFDSMGTFVSCSKTNSVPVSPNNLTGSVTGVSIALSWVDQSTNESSFRIERKSSLTGAWSTVATTNANVVSFTTASTTGIYWYRVFAVNASGDSTSSNEIQVTIP